MFLPFNLSCFLTTACSLKITADDTFHFDQIKGLVAKVFFYGCLILDNMLWCTPMHIARSRSIILIAGSHVSNTSQWCNSFGPAGCRYLQMPGWGCLCIHNTGWLKSAALVPMETQQKWCYSEAWGICWLQQTWRYTHSITHWFHDLLIHLKHIRGQGPISVKNAH